MPTPLTPQEQVLMEQETDYLSLNIPLQSSVVVTWEGRSILVFSSVSDGYYTTDISDLGPSVISQLSNIGSTTPTAWGTITALPASISSTISSEANTAIDAAKSAGSSAATIAQAVSDAVGNSLAGLTGPVIGTLTPVLIGIGVILLLMYLPKKG